MVCPACAVEFVPGVAVCSDCHVGLVEPTERRALPLPDDAVEAASTGEATVARAWRDALTLADVAHAIELTPVPGERARFMYALFVAEADHAWADALDAVLSEHPSLDAAEAVRQADACLDADPPDAEFDDAAFDDIEFDDAEFDVPDLLPPPEVQQQINVAGTIAAVGLTLAAVLATAAIVVSPWWALPALIAAVESARARRRARGLLAAWQRESGWEPPTR